MNKNIIVGTFCTILLIVGFIFLSQKDKPIENGTIITRPAEVKRLDDILKVPLKEPSEDRRTWAYDDKNKLYVRYDNTTSDLEIFLGLNATTEDIDKTANILKEYFPSNIDVADKLRDIASKKLNDKFYEEVYVYEAKGNDQKIKILSLANDPRGVGMTIFKERR